MKPVGLSLESGLAVGRARRDQDFRLSLAGSKVVEKKRSETSGGTCECVGADELRCSLCD